jgi:hypothetical protein
VKPRTTWREKLADNKGLPQVKPLAGKSLAKWGPGTLLLPAPAEVDALMRRVPKGRVTTVTALREALARKHRATIACPLVTGIFAWIAAHAAAEDLAAGKTRVTPYWRTLKSGGELNPKYPGGIEDQRKRLESEGHTFTRKGRTWRLENLARKLASL